MLKQLRVYKNKSHFANVPVGKNHYIQPITQVPWDVIWKMREFARSNTADTRSGEWSWEWQQIPK